MANAFQMLAGQGGFDPGTLAGFASMAQNFMQTQGVITPSGSSSDAGENQVSSGNLHPQFTFSPEAVSAHEATASFLDSLGICSRGLVQGGAQVTPSRAERRQGDTSPTSTTVDSLTHARSHPSGEHPEHAGHTCPDCRREFTHLYPEEGYESPPNPESLHTHYGRLVRMGAHPANGAHQVSLPMGGPAGLSSAYQAQADPFDYNLLYQIGKRGVEILLAPLTAQEMENWQVNATMSAHQLNYSELFVRRFIRAFKLVPDFRNLSQPMQIHLLKVSPLFSPSLPPLFVSRTHLDHLALPLMS